jgi:hypothetical protein
MSEPCANPLCNNRLPEDSRSDKRFCCDDCRLDACWYKILEIGRKNGSEASANIPAGSSNP